MAAAAVAIKEIHYVLQFWGIPERVACTRLIDNEGFNSLKDFGVMDGDKDVQDM